MTDIAHAALLLAEHRLERDPLDALPAELRPRDEAEAYAIQEEVHRQLSARGLGAVVGHKIGCTTPVSLFASMQATRGRVAFARIADVREWIKETMAQGAVR